MTRRVTCPCCQQSRHRVEMIRQMDGKYLCAYCVEDARLEGKKEGTG